MPDMLKFRELLLRLKKANDAYVAGREKLEDIADSLGNPGAKLVVYQLDRNILDSLVETATNIDEVLAFINKAIGQ